MQIQIFLYLLHLEHPPEEYPKTLLEYPAGPNLEVAKLPKSCAFPKVSTVT